MLGQLANRNDLLIRDRPNPLTDALIPPDRRIQFAAAEAMVKLDPRPLPRFQPGGADPRPIRRAQSNPRAVVIDRNAERASQDAGLFRASDTTPGGRTGDQGFNEAVESADVELIASTPTSTRDPGTARPAGEPEGRPRTSGIPVFLVGPLDLRDGTPRSLESFPEARFLVTAAETQHLKEPARPGAGLRWASGRSRPPSGPTGTRRAAGLLAQIARSPGSPFEADLAGRRAGALGWP